MTTKISHGPRGYTQIPDCLRGLLSAPEYLLYGELLRALARNGQNFALSFLALGKACGHGRDWAVKHCRRLVKRGVLEMTEQWDARGDQAPNLYRVLVYVEKGRVVDLREGEDKTRGGGGRSYLGGGGQTTLGVGVKRTHSSDQDRGQESTPPAAPGPQPMPGTFGEDLDALRAEVRAARPRRPGRGVPSPSDPHFDRDLDHHLDRYGLTEADYWSAVAAPEPARALVEIPPEDSRERS